MSHLILSYHWTFCLFTLICQPYGGIEDIPDADVPVVLVVEPQTETSVKKCGGMSTAMSMP